MESKYCGGNLSNLNIMLMSFNNYATKSEPEAYLISQMKIISLRLCLILEKYNEKKKNIRKMIFSYLIVL